MTRNQKIALGCGGAGCLGLLVVMAAGAVLYFAYRRGPTGSPTNRNSNFNINRDRTVNRNSDTDSSDETPPAVGIPSSSMSDDDKHKLFHAAGAANDFARMQKVLTKLGLFKADGSPSEDYADFVGAHIGWLLKNSDFAQTINTPEKARAYVDAHIDD